MKNYQHYFYDHLLSLNLPENTASYLNMLILLVFLIVIIAITDFITRKIILQLFSNFAGKSKTNFDDLLISHKAPRNIAHLVPLMITLKLFPIVFADFPHFENPIEVLIKIYGILLFIWILRSVLKTFESYFKTLPSLKDKPIDRPQ